MPPKGDVPTSAEWKVLGIVSRLKRCAARDVIEEASSSQDWSVSTVKTLLRRLVEKGHLRTTRVGNSFLYEATTSARRSLRAAADALLEVASDRTVGPLLAYMVKKSRLGPDDLAELRALLDEKGEFEAKDGEETR